MNHKKMCIYKPEPVGCPFLITIPHSQCTYKNLSNMISNYSKYSVDVSPSENLNEKIISPNSTTSSLSSSLSISSENGDMDGIIQDDCFVDGDHPIPPAKRRKFILKHRAGNEESIIEEPEDDSLMDLPENRCNLSMEWFNNEKNKDFVIVESKDLDHSCDILEAERVCQENSDTTLEECLGLFTEPEVLSSQEAWYCPRYEWYNYEIIINDESFSIIRCKDFKEATKQLTLWRLPKILIIQLKRFSFKNILFRDKIERMIRFPTRGLDLTEFCCSHHYSSQNEQQKPIYDLYAVINHYGGLFGGHYTAFARTFYEGHDFGELISKLY